MLNHNDILAQTKNIIQSTQLKERVSELFIIALATGFHRGLTPISNFYAMWQIPEHDYQPLIYDKGYLHYELNEVPCHICGLTKTSNTTSSLRDLEIGRTELNAWYKGYYDLLYIDNLIKNPNLASNKVDELLIQPYLPEYSKVLNNLLNFIENMEIGNSASKIEILISKAKILPKSNKASRLWLLRILSQLGILPCKEFPELKGMASDFYPYHQYFEWKLKMWDKFGPRADPVFPFSLYRSGDGVNWEMAKTIFPQLTKME